MMMRLFFLPGEGGVRVHGLGQVYMLKHTHMRTGVRSSMDEVIHEISLSDIRFVVQVSMIFYHFHGNVVVGHTYNIKSDGQIAVTSGGNKRGHFWCYLRHSGGRGNAI